MADQQVLQAARSGEETDIDVLALTNVLLSRKRLIFIAGFAGLFLGALYLHFATFKYTVELDVTPAQASQDNLANSLKKMSGLASLAGVGIPSGTEATPFDLYLAGIHSRDVARELAEKPGLLQNIFPQEWDAGTRAWKQPTGMLPALKNAVKWALGFPDRQWTPPNPARLQEYMQENVIIERSAKNPTVTVSFDHPDPEFGIGFLRDTHEVVDDYLREKALERSAGNIAYLTWKLNRVTVAEYRSALTEALSEQERTRMLASSPAAYAAEPFGNPAASRRATVPNAFFVLLACTIGGILIGVAMSLIHYIRRSTLNAD